MVARDKTNSDLMTITAYDPPGKGRVAHLWFSIWDGAPFYEPFLPNLLRNAVKWAGRLVMTLEVGVSNPTPMQGEEVELYAYVEDERGNVITGASVRAIAGGTSVEFYFSTTAPFRYVGVLDTSELLGDVRVDIYVSAEGLGALHSWINLTITGRFLVDAWLDDATPTKGDKVRAYIRVSDYGGRPVEDATVDIMIGTTSISTAHVSDGLYTADIDTSALSGSVSATVRVEKEGFEAKEVPLALDVREPVEMPTPSLAERLIGDPLGLIALAGLAFGLIGLSLGLVSFFKREGGEKTG